MLTDATGLVLALVGAGLATRAASGRRTYGMQRAEVLAALSNALLLVGVAVWVASRRSTGYASRPRSTRA